MAAFGVATPASATLTGPGVGEGRNITVFHNIDMVAAFGFGAAGEEITIQVLRGGVMIGTATGPLVDGIDGPALEVNHGPEGTPAPGDCWEDTTPDIQPGDRLVVTHGAGVDEITVDDIAFTEGPFEDINGDVVLRGIAKRFDGTPIDPSLLDSAEFRAGSRYRTGPDVVEATPGVAGGFTVRYQTPYLIEGGRNRDGLDEDQQKAVLLTTRDGHSIGFGHTEVLPPESQLVDGVDDASGPAPGCEGSPAGGSNAITSGFEAPINVNSGALTLTGTALQSVTDVSIKVGSLEARPATLSTNSRGYKAWTLTISKEDLSTLADGAITVTSSFDGVAGNTVTLQKDTQAPGLPTASPPPNTYTSAQSVTLNRPDGEPTSSRVFYEIRSPGQALPEPDAGSTPFTTPIQVTASQTIVARAIDSAGNLGPVDTFVYTIDTGPANIAPTVTGRSPRPNASSVGLATNIAVTFSEPVDGVDVDSFQVRDAAGMLVGGAVTNPIGNRWLLNPRSNLTAGATYTVTLTGGTTAIRDRAGAPLAGSPVSWTFTTATTTNAAPTVRGRSPAPNATGVARGSNVSARFSEAVRGVSNGSFALRLASAASGSDPVRAAVRNVVGTNRWVLDPAVTLRPNRQYRVTLTGGPDAIRDLAGAPLANSPVSWTFTTRP